MLSTMNLTAGTLFYSIISWPRLIIADMAFIDVSLGVLACVVTAGDKARTFSTSVYLNRCSLGIFCLLYTSDAADDMQCVDLGGRRIIKK